MFQLNVVSASVLAAGGGNGNARAGILKLAHATLETPVFMPVGTQGVVKAISLDEVNQILKAKIFLANTYHLYLRLGEEILQSAQGLHRFIGWNQAILTDSGGYQIYSLGKNCRIQEDGATFQSHIDGSKHFISPEKQSISNALSARMS